MDNALDLNQRELEKVDEYADWLPPTIVNAHAHSNLPEHVIDLPQKTYNHMMSTFPSYSIEESKLIQKIFHPRTKIHTLRFAHAFKGIDHKAANSYLLANISDVDHAALYGLPDDINYTVKMLADPRVSALKMYYSYLEPNATRIYQIFKPEILSAAQEYGVPIILHPPKVINESVQDILLLKRDFPDLKVSIAHLGVTKFDIPGLQEAYNLLANNTDVMMDNALNPSVEVTTRALQTFGPERIMYGTDEPLNLLRSVSYTHPELGERITTSYLYHWQDPSEHTAYSPLAREAIHSHWITLDALKAAIETLPDGDQAEAKELVFNTNAQNFFSLQ